MALGIILMSQEKKAGWIITFIHASYLLVVYIFFYIMVKENAASMPSSMMIVAFLSIAVLILLLVNLVRELFHVHVKDIIICLVGGIGLYYLTKALMGSILAESIVYILIYVGNIGVLLLLLRNIVPPIASSWNQYIEGLDYTSNEFYKSVEQKLKAKKVKGIGFSHVMISNYGALSSKRKYLRITYEDITHEISFFPASLGMFASSWSYRPIVGMEALLYAIPYIGPWLHKQVFPETYYVKDNRAMMQTFVQTALLEVIDEITEQKGLRKLIDSERTINHHPSFAR